MFRIYTCNLHSFVSYIIGDTGKLRFTDDVLYYLLWKFSILTFIYKHLSLIKVFCTHTLKQGLLSQMIKRPAAYDSPPMAGPRVLLLTSTTGGLELLHQTPYRRFAMRVSNIILWWPWFSERRYIFHNRLYNTYHSAIPLSNAVAGAGSSIPGLRQSKPAIMQIIPLWQDMCQAVIILREYHYMNVAKTLQRPAFKWHESALCALPTKSKTRIASCTSTGVYGIKLTW